MNAPFEVKYPFPVKHVSIHPGIDIAYCDEGSGKEVILFVHGLANYLPVWTQQVKELSKDFRCIALDLPGNGLSSRGDYPYTVFFYAESIRLFMEALQLERVVLAGHSMGGQVAIVLSLRYPQLVERLVLVAPAGIEYFQPHERMLMQQMMNIGDFLYSDEFHLEQAIKESFYSSNAESRRIIADTKAIMKSHPAKQWRDMVTASINGMLNEQVQQFLPGLQMPVLLVFGEQDRMIPNKLIHFSEDTAPLLRRAAAMIPECETLLVKRAGHFVQIEKAAEVNAGIRAFCAR